ncbi:MAG: hypothetical protein AB7I19_07090 [Planctomycetota bacterium]
MTSISRWTWPLAAVSLLAAHGLCQQFSSAIPVPGDANIAPSAGNQRRPAVATEVNGRWFVVWEDDRSSLLDTVYGGGAFGSNLPGNVDIYGCFVDATGQPTSPAPILVNADTWDQEYPRVAWNGSEYLVVFESTKPTEFYYSRGIYAVRVSATGTVIDRTPILIDDNGDVDERFPVVAAVGSDWFVAWSDSLNGNNVVQGARVSSAGVVGSKPILVTGQPGQSPTEHELAANTGQLLLAWSINNSSGVRARFLSPTGAPTGAAISLASMLGLRPTVASDGVGFFAAWSGNGGYFGTPIDALGNVAVPGGSALGFGPGLGKCKAAFDGNQWVVAADASTVVQAVRVSPTGVPSAASTLTTTPRSLTDVAIGSGNGQSFVAWSDSRTTPNSFGVDPADVFGAIFASNAPPAAALSISPPAQVDAMLVGDSASGFVCAWRSLESGVVRFVAHRLDTNGAPIGSPFTIHQGDRSLLRMRVASNGRECVAVWSQLLSTQSNGTPPMTFTRRFRFDGTMLDPAPVPVMEGDVAAVDAVGGTFLIVARFHHPILQSTSIIRSRRLDGAGGAFLDASPRTALFGATVPLEVVGLADRWFVTWGRGTAAFVDQGGTTGSPFYAYDVGRSGGVSRVSTNAARTEAIVAYEYKLSSMPQPDIRMRRFALDGTSPDPLLGPLVNGHLQAQLRPSIVALDGDYVALWADHREALEYEPGRGDVYATDITSAGVPRSAQGIAVLDSFRAEGGQFGIRSARGRALVVASAVVEGGFGTHRLHLLTYSNPATHAWSSLGGGIAGAMGLPRLEGYGSLLPVSGFEITLSNTPPSSIGAFVLGATTQNTPLFGGVLIPTPHAAITAVTDSRGEWRFAATWPAGLGGADIYSQVWLVDATGPVGLTASDGLRGTAPQ